MRPVSLPTRYDLQVRPPFEIFLPHEFKITGFQCADPRAGQARQRGQVAHLRVVQVEALDHFHSLTPADDLANSFGKLTGAMAAGFVKVERAATGAVGLRSGRQGIQDTRGV
jgi:hypothetical protein